MSGSGKTTIARGLMALLVKRGYKVQPFKCGPDYIDTKFHEAVCGRPSINLDTFMATPEHVRELFARYGADADVCVVEGMMGLFDGYDRERGSCYEIARVLDLPVVLVVDARSAAYSMAALLSGFINFRKDIRLAGVIYNKVGSDRHAQMLRQVCDDLNVACFGCLPKSAELEQGSRYLGLDFSELSSKSQSTTLDGQLTVFIEKNIEISRFIELSVRSGQTGSPLRADCESSRRAVRRAFRSSIRRIWTGSDLSAFLTQRPTFPTSLISTCSICRAAILRSTWRRWSGTKPAARPSRTMLKRVGVWWLSAVA